MWRSYVYVSLLIGLVFEVHLGASLNCYECKSSERPCSPMNMSEGIVPKLPCVGPEVCSKDVIITYFNGTSKGSIEKTEHIVRGCMKYNASRDILNKCTHTFTANVREEWWRCLCNDTDYCNGGHALGHQRHHQLEIPAVVQMVGITALTALIMNRYHNM